MKIIITKKKLKKYSIWAAIIAIVSPILIILSLVLSIKAGLWGRLPSEMELKFVANHEASQVWSSDGKVIGKYYKENRIIIGLDEIPISALNALVATEDARFFEHKGVDLIALSRVLVKTILMSNSSAGGGSTISQQLAKNLYGRKRFAIMSMAITKIREMIIASRLEEVYTKDEILALYLNTVSFGENIYGIENASQRYFSKKCKNLKTEESAVLIGLLKGNTLYNPRKHPDRSLERRNTVLSQMYKYAYLKEGEYLELIEKPLKLNYKSSLKDWQENGYFLDYIKTIAHELINEYNTEHKTDFDIYTSGLKIETTLDKELQDDMRRSANKHLKSLQPQLDQQLRQVRFWNKNKELLDDLKVKTSKKEPVLVPWFDDDSVMQMTSEDSLKHCMTRLQTSVMAADPSNGAIRVWIGGNNYQYAPYNRVLSKRQVGSTFKPIVYYSALEKGIAPCKMIKNELKVYEEYDNWSPRNSDGNYEGYYSMKGALANSVNTVTAEMLFEAGIDKVIENARKLGISSDLPEVPSIALGTASISMFEMVQAYACIANKGKFNNCYAIERITAHDGTILFEHEPQEAEQVLRGKFIRYLTGMMQAVADQGTARRLRSTYKLAFDIAAKTGTTQKNTDGWFMGFTKKLVMGVWVGADVPAVHFQNTRVGQGANTALPIWAAGMSRAERRAHDKYTGSFGYKQLSKLDCVLYNDKKKRHDKNEDADVRTAQAQVHSAPSRNYSSSARTSSPRQSYTHKTSARKIHKKRKKKKFKLFK